MHIKADKYITLIILLLMSVSLLAQVGRRKYVTRSGDTTVVVMAGSTGLYGSDASFLLDQRASEDFLDRRSRYSRLKDAIQETEKVANIVGQEHKRNNQTAGSLGFAVAQQNIRYLQETREAEQLSRSNVDTNASAAEIAYMNERFGGRPSYFVNGIAVDPATASRISRNAILSRELRVVNTSTGNPNGEVWMVITSQAYDRLNLGVAYAENAADGNEFYQIEQKNDDIQLVLENEHLQSTQHSEQDKKFNEQQRELEELRRIVSGYGTTDNTSETRTLTKKVGNRFVDPQEEIFSYRDSPQERSRRARDNQEESSAPSVRLDNEDVIQVSNQVKESFSDPNITEETPKRSIRRIKERQRNQ